MDAVKAYLSQIGKRGGESRSPAKVAASKANGKKGGRPKNPLTLNPNPPRIHHESND